MADNTTLNTGSGGDVIASDDIAGVKYQRIKLIHGADNTNDGDVATTNPLPVDQREVGGVAVDLGAGNAGGGTQRVVLATDQAVVSIDDNAGSLTVDGTITADAGTGTRNIQGDVAHNVADSGNPVSLGAHAVTFGASPPVITTDDRRIRLTATPHGALWVLGGYPNIISREYMTTTAQTDDDLIESIPFGSYVIITEIEVLASSAGTTNPQVRIGFGLSTVPAEPSSGASVESIVLSHPGIAAGSGVVRGNGSGVIAIGGSGSELRITCDAPTDGKLTVLISYYISQL